MKKVNQEISNDISRKSDFSFEVTGQTGKVTHFAHGNTGTVQPVALLRLGVFVPTPTATGKTHSIDKVVTMDVSNELQHMEVASSEGYKEIPCRAPG